MKYKIILVSFLASLPFWFAFNIFTDNFKNILSGKGNSYEFLAQSSSFISEKPKQIEVLDIKAKSALSLLVDKNGNKLELFSKNSDERLPIASLTKIMSSEVILDNFDLFSKIDIKEEYLLKRSIPEIFRQGESFKTLDLLYASYIESENDGISALTSAIGDEGFVDLMNLEADYLGLKSTYFFNSTGLDPIDSSDDGINLSTARDMAELSIYFFEKPLASNISLTKMYNLYTYDGIFHHRSINTNEMLDKYSKFGDFEIIGGKTGSTLSAGSCLVLVLKNEKNGSILANVVLNSENRYEDMEKMVNWSISSYDI